MYWVAMNRARPEPGVNFSPWNAAIRLGFWPVLRVSSEFSWFSGFERRPSKNLAYDEASPGSSCHDETLPGDKAAFQRVGILHTEILALVVKES